MSARLVALSAMLLVAHAGRAQDIAIPPRVSPAAYAQAMAELGDLLAVGRGLPDVKSVAPSCVESTAAAMAAADAEAREEGQQAPWGSKGDAAEVLEAWRDQVLRSCAVAITERLLAPTQVWVEVEASRPEAVWHAVFVPLSQASLWVVPRSDGRRDRACEERAQSSKARPLGYEQTGGTAGRDGFGMPRVQAGRCLSPWASASSRDEADAWAERLIRDIGLDATRAELLAAYVYEAMARVVAANRQVVRSQICSRISSYESGEALGRALNQAQEISLVYQTEVVRSLWGTLNTASADRVERYAVEKQPTVRVVDYAAWFAQLRPEVWQALMRARCAL